MWEHCRVESCVTLHWNHFWSWCVCVCFSCATQFTMCPVLSWFNFTVTQILTATDSKHIQETNVTLGSLFNLLQSCSPRLICFDPVSLRFVAVVSNPLCGLVCAWCECPIIWIRQSQEARIRTAHIGKVRCLFCSYCLCNTQTIWSTCFHRAIMVIMATWE